MNAFITYKQTLASPDALEEGTPVELAPDDFAWLVEFMVKNKLPTCVLEGNEPTLHSALGELIDTAGKHEVRPFLETCGLIRPTAKSIIMDAKLQLVWKLYHPDFYTKAQWDEMSENCRALERALPGRISLCAVFHDLTQDYGYVIDFLRTMSLQSWILRVLPPSDLAPMRRFATWVVPQMTALAQTGLDIRFECGLPPCALTDAQHGALAKLRMLPDRCLPAPGVLPDGRLYHCRQLIDDASTNIRRFRKYPEIADYLFTRYVELEQDFEVFDGCAHCLSLRTDVCHGRCMAVKRGKRLKEIEQLQGTVATDENLEALIRLGQLYWELRQIAHAQECLTEARRVDPGNGEVHLLLARLHRYTGKFAEAEEEYEKAKRLLPDTRSVLIEMSRAFREEGRLDKAKKAMAEIAALPDTDQS